MAVALHLPVGAPAQADANVTTVLLLPPLVNPIVDATACASLPAPAPWWAPPANTAASAAFCIWRLVRYQFDPSTAMPMAAANGAAVIATIVAKLPPRSRTNRARRRQKPSPIRENICRARITAPLNTTPNQSCYI